MPFRLNRLAAEVSSALSAEYQARYGLDIPEWRVLATLGFRNDACSAQYIAHCTRTHKSTISRAVTALMKRQIIERVENADDRREFRLRLTRKGTELYEELIPRLLRREQEILSCLSAPERKGRKSASLDRLARTDRGHILRDARSPGWRSYFTPSPRFHDGASSRRRAGRIGDCRRPTRPRPVHLAALMSAM